MSTRTPLNPRAIFNRLPPQDLDAERGLIGAVVLVNDAFDLVNAIVEPECFYLESHQMIWRAIVSLRSRGAPCDAMTVRRELQLKNVAGGESNELQAVGGEGYLIEVLNSVPHAAHVEYYAKIVVECHAKRMLIYGATELLMEAYAEEIPVEELAAKASGLVNVLEKGQSEDLLPMHQVCSDVLNFVENPVTSGLPTHFRDLDELTGGLKPTQYILLAARPSMGKTALVLNIAGNIAEAGGSVAFFSLEQGHVEIGLRAACMRARVDSKRVEKKTLTEAEKRDLRIALENLSRIPITIDRSSSPTVAEIRAKCRIIARRQPLALVVIDYIQLLKPANPREPREQQVSNISKELKALTKDLNVPVIALAQLSRAVELREEKKPRLSDLRESGSLEQDADVVMFIYREGKYDPEADQQAAELIVAKQRSGSLGTVKLRWHAPFTLFEDGGTDPAAASGLFDKGLPANDGTWDTNFFNTGEPTQGDF